MKDMIPDIFGALWERRGGKGMIFCILEFFKILLVEVCGFVGLWVCRYLLFVSCVFWVFCLLFFITLWSSFQSFSISIFSIPHYQYNIEQPTQNTTLAKKLKMHRYNPSVD